MKLRNLSILAVAAMLAACGGDDDAAIGDDTTALTVDTSMAAPLPVDTMMGAPMPVDTMGMPADTGMPMGDTMGAATTTP